MGPSGWTGSLDLRDAFGVRRNYWRLQVSNQMPLSESFFKAIIDVALTAWVIRLDWRVQESPAQVADLLHSG